MKKEARRLTSPMPGPRRSRTRSNTARPDTDATRPAISAYTTMPTTPTGTTQARFMRNRAPVAALATRSPMSTKPPIAVRIPSVISKTFFTPSSLVLCGERSESVPIGLERRGDRRQPFELASPHGDADVGHVIESRREQRVELGAQIVSGAVGGLDRSERPLRAGERFFLLGCDDRQVRTEGVAGGASARSKADR